VLTVVSINGSTSMRIFLATLAAAAFLAPGLALAAIPCSDLPQAQSFVDKLKPGPNTRAAQQHLAAAKAAGSEEQCSAELQKVDEYARRSAEADKRMAEGGTPHHHHHYHHVKCADLLHQSRPGGSDYKGPPVAGCPKS
jgi:hypothetical protein